MKVHGRQRETEVIGGQNTWYADKVREVENFGGRE